MSCLKVKKTSLHNVSYLALTFYLIIISLVLLSEWRTE